MTDVVVPENTACDGLSPIHGRTIIPPTGNFVGTLWSFNSQHGQPQFVANDRVLDGTKFYVVRGCGVYNTYFKPHYTSFCYILQRQDAVQQTGPPNLLFSPAPPQNLGNLPGLNLPGYKPIGGHAFVFANCARSFAAD